MNLNNLRRSINYKEMVFLHYEGNETSVQPSQNRLPFPMVQILVNQ